ncbi:MAG TPA: hypothetical protein VN283_03870 [Thiobacillus sp.]|nr:hypothetical protein [Thiobacillus sp.]
MWLTMIGLNKMGGNRVRRQRRDGTSGGARRPGNGYRLLSTTGNAFGGHAVKPSGDQK